MEDDTTREKEAGQFVCAFCFSLFVLFYHSFEGKFSHISVVAVVIVVVDVVVVDIQLLAGLMWSNTVIVCKGKVAAELDMDAQVLVCFWRI